MASGIQRSIKEPMSYESRMLQQLAMPTRKEVEEALLRTLLMHGGTIKEFGAGESIVNEIADEFNLNANQRAAYLETVYRKENRVKKAFLWHRLLFRAADALADQQMVSRPSQTLQLTHKREWMLTEKGFDEALKASDIPDNRKDLLPVKSYEVQAVVKRLVETRRPENYDPIDQNKRVAKITRQSAIRDRGFRQAVIEVYHYKCAVCGLKLNTPDSLAWEVEAAHIVPNTFRGRDDLWNGVALCHLHHWAFDAGWFTLLDDYKIQSSPRIPLLPAAFGKMGDYDFIRSFAKKPLRIHLPDRKEIYPHRNSLLWHRKNIFYQPA